MEVALAPEAKVLCPGFMMSVRQEAFEYGLYLKKTAIFDAEKTINTLKATKDSPV